MRSFADNNRRLIHVRRFVTVIMVIVIAWQAAGLTWRFIGPAHDMTWSLKSRPQAVGVVSRARTKGVEQRKLAPEIALFGVGERTVESTAPRRVARNENAPLTSLALLLKGVVMMDPVNRALAIIVEKGKGDTEKLYAVGETVPGNAVVDEIFFDRVILRRGGAFETLLLLGNESIPEKKSQVSRRRKNDGIQALGDGINWQIDRGYWNQRLADIPTLAREIGVEVYKENNVQKGYKLLSARGSKLLKDLGLQPGDVLHEVNGVPLNSVHDGLAVYKNITNATEVRVVFTRNGNREARVYKIGR